MKMTDISDNSDFMTRNMYFCKSMIEAHSNRENHSRPCEWKLENGDITEIKCPCGYKVKILKQNNMFPITG